MKKQYKLRYVHQPTLLLSSVLLLCILLLSACGSSNGNSTVATTPTALPIPTIDPTLKNQGDMQLKTFQQWITLMQQYGGNTTTYQQEYNNDQQALATAKTSTIYKAALTQLNMHVQAIQIPAMKIEDQNLLQQLQQQVDSWGKQHTYHDTFNNTIYQLGFEYSPNGIGSWAQSDLNSAQTIADYQQAIENLNMYLANFQAMTTNFSDKTPYNQPHKTDLQLLQHYSMMKKRVIVVSLGEQAMRVYQNGQLVKAFLVTTGRPDRPSPPGTWWVEGKKSPTVFKAGVPQSSPYWYPDTPINYAIQYHSDGYFIHDSWWRTDYGPGTNFPHQDSSGDPFSAQGSHGCVNMAKDDAAWVYGFVQLYTSIVIY
jgi:L,D-transpeptidase catalytic domain